MKKLFASSLLAGLLVSSTVYAGCCGWGSDGPYDDNDWPEWTPMYWMEEFFNDDEAYYPPPYGYGYPPPPGYYHYGYPPVMPYPPQGHAAPPYAPMMPGAYPPPPSPPGYGR